VLGVRVSPATQMDKGCNYGHLARPSGLANVTPRFELARSAARNRSIMYVPSLWFVSPSSHVTYLAFSKPGPGRPCPDRGPHVRRMECLGSASPVHVKVINHTEKDVHTYWLRGLSEVRVNHSRPSREFARSAVLAGR